MDAGLCCQPGEPGELLFTAKALPWATEKTGAKPTDRPKFLQSVKMLKLDFQLGLVLD